MFALVAGGCRSTNRTVSVAPAKPPAVVLASYADDPPSVPDEVAGEIDDEVKRLPTPAVTAESIAKPVIAPTAEQVVVSVRNHFPIIQQAVAAREIAAGEALSATGAFDHKLEGYSNSQPLDFYENYRQGVDLKRDTYWGGQTFAGYRIGRGDFEPWYLERETNKGGEFNAGFFVPLAKDRAIDANRAELWRAQLEQNRVEPEIRAAVIGSVRDGVVAYWVWVASGANLEIAEGVLELGLNRTDFLEEQVKAGEKAEIDLVDNQRIIVSRQAKVIDARRKLQQSAQKLSLFLRDDRGVPQLMPLDVALGDLPRVPTISTSDFLGDEERAIANRPELAELSFVREQFAVALRQAGNETLPDLDAGIKVAQDVGEPTSSKRDKSELQLNASVLLSVPLERRKALGKVRQLEGKLAQLRAKLRFAEEKIVAEVGIARAALVAAAERVEQTSRGLELARQMQEAENDLYEAGQSNLLNLNLRENQAAEAAIERLSAQLDYYVAAAEYSAALGEAGSTNP